MKGIFILVTSLFAVTLAFADETAVRKYRNYTPQQINDLPEKEKSSSLPMMYIFAAQRGLSTDPELLFGMDLNRLMYPGIHDYKAAVKAFQQDLGDKPTGILTVWQIHNLQQRSEMQRLSRVNFPDRLSSFKTDDYASIEGTMMIIDEKAMWPINHTKVRCFRGENYCALDQILLTVPDDKSWTQVYGVIQDSTEHYEIARWDQDSIDTRPKETSDRCRTTSMNLNFKTKEFYYITRNAGGECKFLDATLDKLPKPRISQILDGAKIISEEFAKIEKAAYDVLASDFRKKVIALEGSEGKKRVP
jgi:hypothetical protein